jgi:DNA-binding MarR family transcriptional regulator
MAEALQQLAVKGTTVEIAREAGMTVGNVSGALAKLVEEGCVRRLAREGHRVPYECVEED